MEWKKLVMLLVNMVFVKQNINQVLFILFTKLVNCTFAQNLVAPWPAPLTPVVSNGVEVNPNAFNCGFPVKSPPCVAAH